MKKDLISIEWKLSQGLVDYPQAVEAMEQRVQQIAAGQASELVWLLEHPPLYTAGTSAQFSDLLDGSRFPVFQSGRGGQFTYHGPGQRVAYVLLDLKKRAQPHEPDIRHYVQALEQWVIATLKHFGLIGHVRNGRIGVWVVDTQGNEAKIAAIGIRVRRWVSYHGISLNVYPDLSHYGGIVPCGIQQYGVTSLKKLGIDATMAEIDAILKQEFEQLF